ncbi:reprolysin-like metallopeptidase [uncultured Flavobacterium sp.]|uniref:reprolysin-like metallopeptidase n=1 Tax=uncultured Flavobacterium sp. TaxID=165435 RepID=UPI0030C8A2CF
MLKKKLLLLILFFSFSLFAQTNNWQIKNERELTTLSKVRRANTPKNYKILSLNLENFKNQLLNAPVRGSFLGRSTHEILLPNADGKIERYHVMETPIMEQELADKFPMIKSYAAQGVDDPTAIARFSVTQFGLHSMTFSSGKSTVFIDPYTENAQNYIVYKRSDLERGSPDFECLTEEDVHLPSLETDRNAHPINTLNTDDSTLRTYRLAQSCTAEYGNIFAGTGTTAQQKANIQAQMAITMTRVNGVYEIDLGITMVFVANNDLIIYLGSTTSDPWSNEWNTKTAQTIDSVIGVNNYDIGHNFNTTGGGNAGCLACVCKSTSQNNTHKGRGYTGRSNPTGDAFDIDYVAHEMGHQFGGYHTQSNSNCRSGSGATEVEPGSGSTIMAYAGICAANVQNNSDAYFGYVNIRDISDYVKTTAGSCSVNVPFSNQPPIVSAGSDYTIPKSTAFILTATGSDPDGDPLTYTWEQNDPENPNSNAAPTSTRTSGPMFRSLTGTTSPSRYMPDLATVLTGATSNTWEVVPSVARNMSFSVLVRDNVAGAGQTSSDLMDVTVSGTAGPFLVNSPNTNVSWQRGSNQTITWDVAGTTSNGVDCEFVDIYLSSNGGASFPTLLASKVPNDGSEVVTMPSATGTNRRIMVKGNSHIFYDVSNTNFTVTTSSSTFSLSYDGTIDGQNKVVCQGDDASYDIKYETIGGFSANTTFSVSGNPAGTIVVFSPSTVSSDEIITMTLSNTSSVSPGIYSMTVSGTSGATTKTVNLYLQIRNSAFSQMTLVSPADGAFALPTAFDLQWNADAAATNYYVEVATDIDFNSIFLTTNTTSTSYQLTGLSENTNYFWRVLAKNEGCQGVISPISRFTTGQNSCSNVNSTNVPLTISASGTPTVNSTLTIPAINNVTISDISVTLNITHTWISDLTVTLISPSGTQVQLFSGQCTSNDNAIATFSTNGSVLSCGTNPAITGNLAPTGSFNSLIGTDSQGTWTLRVFDSVNQDGGTINSWSLNICSTPNTPLTCGQITTTWNGTSWSNGYPVSNVAATINGNFTSTRDLEACSLNIIGNSNVILSSGYNFIIENEVNIENTANLTLQNNSNLIQIENASNIGNATVFRETNPLKRLDYVLWSNPLASSQTLKNFSPETLNNRFYYYNTQANAYNVIANPVSTTFQPANGYLIRMPNNHPTTPTIWTGQFTSGVPNNGNFDVNLAYFGSGFNYNLIGNPYPSTINAETFLINNSSDIEGVIYLFREENNAAGSGYATYTLGGATTTTATSPIPNGTIQVGQGFIVGAKNVTTPKVTFSNDLRVDNNNNQFFRMNFGKSVFQTLTLEKNRIWLNLTNDNGFFSQMMIGYISNATLGFDNLIDGKSINDSPTFLSSLINNEEYTIQGRPLPFDVQDIVPLKFKTQTAGNFTISINNFDGLFEGNQEIYLKDNLLNITHNIKNSPYTFTSVIGEFDSRFEIVYQNSILDAVNLDTNNQVLVSTENNNINVRSTNQFIQEITVFDILGRNLSSNSKIENNDFVISHILPTKQTLIVKILLANGITEVRKIQF